MEDKAKEALLKRYKEIREELESIQKTLDDDNLDERLKKLSTLIGKYFVKDNDIFVRCERINEDGFDVIGTEIWCYKGQAYSIKFGCDLCISSFDEEGYAVEITKEEFNEKLRMAQELIKFDL